MTTNPKIMWHLFPTISMSKKMILAIFSNLTERLIPFAIKHLTITELTKLTPLAVNFRAPNAFQRRVRILSAPRKFPTSLVRLIELSIQKRTESVIEERTSTAAARTTSWIIAPDKLIRLLTKRTTFEGAPAIQGVLKKGTRKRMLIRDTIVKKIIQLRANAITRGQKRKLGFLNHPFTCLGNP